MPRYKAVITSISRSSGPGQIGYSTKTFGTPTTMYIESNLIEIQPEGTTTLFVDNISGNQYHCQKAFSAVVTALDTASASPQNQVDLT